MDGTNFYLDHFHFFHFHFNQHSNPQLGAKPEKTVLGVPLYGRSFLLQNKANNGGKIMMMMLMIGDDDDEDPDDDDESWYLTLSGWVCV